MELAQRKINFRHTFIQIQAIQQVADNARKKLQEKPDKSSPELKFLWEKCCDASTENVGHATVTALVSLAQDGVIDGNDVISTAVNYTSSSRSPGFLLQLIGEVLKLHVQAHADKNDGGYSCPYNLRAPPHPFISVLAGRPELWQAVCGVVELILDDCMVSEAVCLCMLEMLRPVFMYVLLNPADSLDVRLCRNAFLNCLVAKAQRLSTANSKSFQKLLTDILWLCVTYNDITAQTVSSYVTIAELLRATKDDIGKTADVVIIFVKMLKYASGSASPCDKIFVIRSMGKILPLFEDGRSQISSLCLVGIAKLLNQCPLPILGEMLGLLESFLERVTMKELTPLEQCHVYVSLIQLQIFATTEALNGKSKFLLKKLTKVFEKAVENSKIDSESLLDFWENWSGRCVLDEFMTSMISYTSLFRKMLHDEELAIQWLRGIEILVTQGADDTEDTTSLSFLHCVLLLHSIHCNDGKYEDITHQILENLKLLAKSFPRLSYSILPVLLVTLKKTTGSLKQKVLFTLPHLASHPYSVTPILNIIQSLATDSGLKPLALRLMLELWTVQDRCYPHLQKMLTAPDVTLKMKLGNADMLLLRAIVVNKICADRPHQYGSDMLKLLKPVVTAAASSGNISKARKALSVDGLYHLCVSKILDVKSMWNELGVNLTRETKGVVAKKVLNLLSLVAELKVAGAADENFKSEVIRWVWERASDCDVDAKSAALCCLSRFDWQDFKIVHLPTALRPEKPEDVEDAEFLERPVPGQCCMVLVKTAKGVPGDTIASFLSSLLRQELNNLPRDIHHRAMMSQRRAARPEPLRGIPDFTLNLYERNRQPNLKASLAFSLLLSHNPTPELDRGGKPVQKSVISLGRNFLQIMQALLKEVPIEPNSWQSVLWVSHGWKVFTKRCMAAMLESRRAELAMQLSRANKEGGDEDMDDIQQKQATAMLWCRDKITNALKTASKGNPVMQGNAVFALASLITALAADDFSDHEESGDSEYLSMSHWTAMAVDTVISIANPAHVASGRIFSWCQYRSVSLIGRLTTTQLGKVCAVQSLPILVPMAVPTYNGKILDMLKFLLKEREEDADNLAFHCSLGLGRMVGALYGENFQEIGGQGGSFVLSESFAGLEKNAVESQTESGEDLGSLLGFGLAFASRLQTGDPLFSQQARNTLKHLLQVLKTEDESPQYTQALCSVLSWGYISALSCQAIDSNQALELVNVVTECMNETPHNPSIAEALGTLCNGLYLTGSSEIMKNMDGLFEQWYQTLSKDQVPTRQRLSALSGVAALVGANCTIMPHAIDVSMLTMAQYISKLSAVIKVLKHFSRNSKDAGVPTKSIELLSRFYISFESVSGVIGSSVPPSYEYLPHTSILRYLFDYISETAKGVTGSAGLLQVALIAISTNACRFSFPPANWVSVFSPLLNSNENPAVKIEVVKIAVALCTDSPTLAAFLSSWISLPKFNSLSDGAKAVLCGNVDKLVKCQEQKVFEGFVNVARKHCLNLLVDGNSDTTISFLGAIKTSLLQSTQISEASLRVLLDCVENFFTEINFNSMSASHNAALSSLAQCLLLHPQGDSIISKYENSNATPSNALKSLFVRCYCVSHGGHSLSMCNNAIECCGEVAKDEALPIIAGCFEELAKKTDATNDMVEWMQEVMGKLKNITRGTTQPQLAMSLLDVYAVAVVCWAGLGVVNGITGCQRRDAHTNSKTDQGHLQKISCSLLPTALPRLLSQKHWAKMVQPTVDWLLLLKESMTGRLGDEGWVQTLSNALFALRGCKVCQSPSVWCKVAMSIHEMK